MKSELLTEFGLGQMSPIPPTTSVTNSQPVSEDPYIKKKKTRDLGIDKRNVGVNEELREYIFQRFFDIT